VNRESHGFKPWEDVNDREPAEVTNLDRYGNPELPWSRARDALAAAASGPDITLGQVGGNRPGPGGRGHQGHRQGPAGAAGRAVPCCRVAPAEVDGDALTAPFSAPSAGPPPWQLYRFVLQTGFGVATEEPYGATRWRFR
jgi:hypothetical protein